MKIRSPLNILGRITLGVIKSLIPVIEFIGDCITNLLIALKYLLMGKVNFKNTLQQIRFVD